MNEESKGVGCLFLLFASFSAFVLLAVFAPIENIVTKVEVCDTTKVVSIRQDKRDTLLKIECNYKTIRTLKRK